MKSGHGELQHFLPEYTRGMLPEEMRQAVADHVSRCAICSEELALLSILSGTSVPEPAPSFWTDLKRASEIHITTGRHRQNRQPVLRSLFGPVPVTVAACIVIVFMAGQVIVPSTHQDLTAFRTSPALFGEQPAGLSIPSADSVTAEDLLAYSGVSTEGAYYSDLSSLNADELDQLYRNMDDSSADTRSEVPGPASSHGQEQFRPSEKAVIPAVTLSALTA